MLEIIYINFNEIDLVFRWCMVVFEWERFRLESFRNYTSLFTHTERGGHLLVKYFDGVVGGGLWLYSFVEEGECKWYTFIYLLYLFVEEGECEWYTYGYMLYSFVEEGKCERYTYSYLLYSFMEERECEWYTCAYVLYSFVKEEHDNIQCNEWTSKENC